MGLTSKSVMTMDYLRGYSFVTSPEYARPADYFVMNDKYIVAWDRETLQLSYWSRRSLVSLKMDQVQLD